MTARNGFKDDIILGVLSLKKVHLIIGKGHYKRINDVYGPLKCHNCEKPIEPETEVVIRPRGHAITYKMWCGDCARTLAII